MKKQRQALLLGFFLLSIAVGKTQNADVFKPKNIKQTMLKVVDWQLKNPLHKPNDWTNGAFYAGVYAAYETTKSPKILDSLMALGERMAWQPANRFDHADDIAISQTYISLYRLKHDRRMIQPTLDSVEKMRTIVGNETRNHGIMWWWCDALFMAPPTLAMLGNIPNSSSMGKRPPSDGWGGYFALNDSLFQLTYDLLWDKDEQLFYRDAAYLLNAKGEGKREANGKKVFWSRGNGWVLGGLVRLLKELPKDYPKRPFYLTIYKQMMAKIQSLQQADGLWRSSLLDPSAYPGGEGSGSGFDCYAMAWGINNGILDKATYAPSVKKAWTGLNKLVLSSGCVGWVQPIGADPRRNFSENSWEVFGAGAFLLAASEVIKMQ